MVQFPSLQTASVDDAQERTLQLEGAGGHQWELHQKLRDEHVAQHQIRFSRGTLSGGPWQVYATVIAGFLYSPKTDDVSLRFIKWRAFVKAFVW